jgi:antitoxin ParD1/3/4
MFGGGYLMNISLRPDLERFVEKKVRAGEYGSADQVLEAALIRLMDDDDELDYETLAAIEEGDAQLDRGEGMPLSPAFLELRKKHFQK